MILSQAALFTEINVVMPVTLLHYSRATLLAKAARFWTLAFVANLAGAWVVGYFVATRAADDRHHSHGAETFLDLQAVGAVT